ncbi:MAG: hypothetical protein ACPGYT_01445 [Nitrospirales bacterium]
MDTIFQIVLVTSFLIHGILKSLVIGGVPILMLTYYRGRYGGAHDYYRSLAQGMSQLAPMTMGLAVAFGLLAWTIIRMQYEWELTPFFDSNIGGWIVFLMLLLIGFWGVVAIKRYGQDDTGSHWAIGGVVTCCMMAIAGIFVTSHIEMLSPTTSPNIQSAGVINAQDVATFWPRFLHVVFSGFAITGIVLTIYGSLRPQCPEDHALDPAPYDIRLVRYGVGWVLGGTVPQVVVGPWFMLALPSDVRFHLVDGTTVVSLIFFMSLTLTLLSLVLLNSSLLVPQKRGLVWGGVGSLVLTTVFMVLVREEVRKVGMISQGVSVGLGELSWIVVISVVAIMGTGLYLGGRYVTLTGNQIESG